MEAALAMEIRGVKSSNCSSVKDYKSGLQIREAVEERKAKGEIHIAGIGTR